MTPREDAYDECISPLMTQIIALCKEHDIPMVAQFELDAHNEGPLLVTTCLVENAVGERIVEVARLLRRNFIAL